MSASPPPVCGAFALFDNNFDAAGQAGAWLLTDLVEEVVCHAPADWAASLTRLEAAARSGAWVALAASYELGYVIEPHLARHLPPDAGPLLTGWIFRHAEWLADAACDAWLAVRAGKDAGCTGALQPNIEKADYLRQIDRIRRYITDGDCYQVNFTFPMRSRFTGDPEGLFWSLAPASRAPHAAFLDCGGTAVVSLSPELFFSRTGDRLEMRPMKGTRLRGRFPEEDGRQATELAISAKERAENLMIVDMVRNDLGRIAGAGSVAVESLFALERYPTVWQMTSTVSARSRARLTEVFAALFPCASVTGAPKARTMDWIARLERFPRGVYCGAIGWVAPTRRASFSVAIRTAVIDRTAGTLSYGVGSGVVWDSKPAAEYLECLAKARAFVAPPPPFALFETMLWRPRCGVALLENHLARLAASANYFGFSLDARAWRSAVEAGLAGPDRAVDEQRTDRLAATTPEPTHRTGTDDDWTSF